MGPFRLTKKSGGKNLFHRPLLPNAIFGGGKKGNQCNVCPGAGSEYMFGEHKAPEGLLQKGKGGRFPWGRHQKMPLWGGTGDFNELVNF